MPIYTFRRLLYSRVVPVVTQGASFLSQRCDGLLIGVVTRVHGWRYPHVVSLGPDQQRLSTVLTKEMSAKEVLRAMNGTSHNSVRTLASTDQNASIYKTSCTR